ncbi:hypothetical protein [Paraburkholderia sp. RL17-373-BIF-A]|uniref:hypothetical protein n=1 Tax=Paraburkholderia sp. RL17-373-BIF-A TaxID=3031629 RepID=UPI0038BBF4B0
MKNSTDIVGRILSALTFGIAAGIYALYSHLNSREKTDEYANLAKAILTENANEQERSITVRSNKHGEITFRENGIGLDVSMHGQSTFIPNMSLDELKSNIKADMLHNYSSYFNDEFDAALNSVQQHRVTKQDASLLNQIYGLPSDWDSAKWNSMPDLNDKEVELLMRLRIERMCAENYPTGGSVDVFTFRSCHVSDLRSIYRPGEVNKDTATMLQEKPLTVEEEKLVAKLNGGTVDYSTMFQSFGYDAKGHKFCVIHPLVSYALNYKSSLPNLDLEEVLPGSTAVNRFVMEQSCLKSVEYKENKTKIDAALAKVFEKYGTLNIETTGSSRNELC